MWRRIVDGGWLGTTYWTNSMIHGPDVSTGTWVPVLPADGEYDVYAYIPEEHSVANCVYKIGHTSGLAEVVIDQSLFGDEWVYLGCWDFTAADSPFVYLGDSTGTSGENIAVDAVVWRTHIVGVAERKLPEKPEISVYPNPYRSDAGYTDDGYEDPQGTLRFDYEHRIHFINLPERCTIKIWTTDGDLVRVIEHYPGGPYSDTNSKAHWDMISRNTQAIVSGLYIYSIESETGTQIGKIVVIK